MTQDPEYRALSAYIKVILALDLFLIDHGHKEIGREKHQSAVEIRRGDAHDGKRIFIYLNNAAYHAGIIVKIAMPVRVGEDDIGSAVRAMLIGRVKETAKIRTQP